MKASKIKIYPMQPEDNNIIQVAELYRELNDSEVKLGLSVSLIEEGEKMWMKMIKNNLGKSAQIVVADDNGLIAGFSYGTIRIAPPYYGGILIGYWEAMIIKEEYRGQGIGDQMTLELIKWWKLKKVSVIEGERIITNLKAKNNFARLGFKEELIKYRRRI